MPKRVINSFRHFFMLFVGYVFKAVWVNCKENHYFFKIAAFSYLKHQPLIPFNHEI